MRNKISQLPHTDSTCEPQYFYLLNLNNTLSEYQYSWFSDYSYSESVSNLSSSIGTLELKVIGCCCGAPYSKPPPSFKSEPPLNELPKISHVWIYLLVGEVDCARVTLKVVVAALSVLRRRWRAGRVALLSLLHKFVLFLGFRHWRSHWRLRLGFLRLLLLSLHHHLVLVHLVVIGLLLAIPEHRLEIMLLHVTHHFNMLCTQCIIILANVAPVLATVRVVATRVTRVGALPFLFLVLLLIFLVLFLLFLLLQVSLRLFWWF